MTTSYDVMDETWKSIPGFNGYKVSDHGNVKSFRRACAHKAVHGQILSLTTDFHGYARVNLHKDRKPHPKQVHRLVLETHVGESLNGDSFVHHKDGNKLNNNLSNLEWANNSSNAIHARSSNGGRVLRLDQVREIKKLIKAQVRTCDISEMFGINKTTVFDIKRGRSWRGVGE